MALRSESIDQILTEACRIVSEALKTDLATIMDLQEDGKTLLVPAGVGWKEHVVGKVEVEACLNFSDEHALATGNPFISEDIAIETRALVTGMAELMRRSLWGK